MQYVCVFTALQNPWFFAQLKRAWSSKLALYSHLIRQLIIATHSLSKQKLNKTRGHISLQALQIDSERQHTALQKAFLLIRSVYFASRMVWSLIASQLLPSTCWSVVEQDTKLRIASSGQDSSLPHILLPLVCECVCVCACVWIYKLQHTADISKKGVKLC